MAVLSFRGIELPELNADFLVYRVNDDITLAEAKVILIKDKVPLDKGVIIHSTGPDWVKTYLAKMYKENKWVAVYNPKTESAKVVISNTPQVKIGMTFKVDSGIVEGARLPRSLLEFLKGNPEFIPIVAELLEVDLEVLEVVKKLVDSVEPRYRQEP